MTSKELFVFLLLTLTLSQWIAYFKLRSWWRTRTPEPKQGKPVDRVLYHTLTDTDLPWDAGKAWERCGRGYIVAMERQGLDELLDEHDVNDYKPVFTLGYCVREAEDTKELEAITKQLQRREEALKRAQQDNDRLKFELSKRPEEAPKKRMNPERTPAPLTEALEEWGRCPASVDQIMEGKGWKRVEPPAQPQQIGAQSEAVYSNLTGDERKRTMSAMKDEGKSYTEIARLFGVSSGCVKSTVSQWRRRNEVVSVDFTGSSDVCESV